MKEKNRQRRLRLVAEAKKKPAVFTVYIILRLIVVAILVSSILRGEYENAAICLLVLFLFLRGIMDKIIVSANFFPILSRIGLSERFLTTFLKDDISEVPL